MKQAQQNTISHSHGPRPQDDWFQLLQHGDFERAWKVCDRVLTSRAGIPCSHLPRHLQYIWDGTPLQGKRVLVRCYHGLGDTIQFIRYATLIKAVAAEVIVWAQPALISLLATMPAIDKLLPLHDGAPRLAYDVDIESMELPHAFRSTLSTLPAEVPYLHVPRAQLCRDERMAVGLVWKGGEWDEQRSIPIRLLGALAKLPNIAWHILQRGPAMAEWPEWLEGLPGSDDIFATAQIMRGLDLVISVDSMPAHLAGSLGVPMWNLLQYEADWRWMKERDDSPWYPTMRLFRQERQGEWQSVVERLGAELRSLSQNHLRERVAT
ncbi:MAG TPA: hypothetical protein VGO73_03395 [Pyrinomonadaceae bacterium]|jgi:hypothetical protein|nr:hypothetical protein [Pyrinomonadaceae bacterium]